MNGSGGIASQRTIHRNINQNGFHCCRKQSAESGFTDALLVAHANIQVCGYHRILMMSMAGPRTIDHAAISSSDIPRSLRCWLSRGFFLAHYAATEFRVTIARYHPAILRVCIKFVSATRVNFQQAKLPVSMSRLINQATKGSTA